MRKIAYIFVWLFCVSIPMQELAASTLVSVSGTLSRLVGIAAAMVGLAAVIYDGRLRSFGVVHGVIALYLAWGGLTYLWSADQLATFGRLITNIQLLMMVVLFSQFASREDENAGLLVAYVTGAALSLFQLFWMLASGTAAVTTMFTERYTAFDNNPNDYALALAIAIPMAWYIASRRISIFTTILGYGYTAIGFVGVILTGSRGGFLAAVAGALFIPLSIFRLGRRERLAAIIVCVAGFSLAVKMTPDTVWARLSTIETIGEEVPGSEMEGVNIRTVVWKQGFLEFASNPRTATIGVGAAAYQWGVEAIYGDELVAHNVFVSILIEQGIVGMTMFMIILILMAISLKYLPTAERYVWIFTFLSWGVGVMFVTWEQTKNTWFIIGLLAARSVTAKYGSSLKPGFLATLFRRTRMGLRLRRHAY